MIECLRALSLPQSVRVLAHQLTSGWFFYLTHNMRWFILAAQQQGTDWIIVELCTYAPAADVPLCKCSRVSGYL